MKNKGKIFSWLMVLYSIIIFCFLFLILEVNLYAEENQVPNPFQELITWTIEQNVGLTALYDLDKKIYEIGGKWQFVKSKHEWFYSGLNATTGGELGAYISFNLGKAIEKIKGEPLVYLKHLELGYFYNYDFNLNEWRDGVLLNVIKIEW